MSLIVPALPELTFDEKTHRYCWDGRWLHLSPTKVLGFDMDPIAKQRIEDTKHGPDGWEIRGNTLHGHLERYLSSGVEPEDDEFKEWWGPLRDCWLWKDAEMIGVELRMTDKENMGGSCDFLLRTADGLVCLGDLKTVSSKRAVDSRKPATAQLGAYAQMIQKCWPKVFIDKCCTVVCGPGKTRVITEEPDECWLAWEEALGKYQAHVDLLGF